jgi:hypothetical protein
MKIIESFKADDKGTEREIQLVEKSNGKIAVFCTFTGVGLKEVNHPNPQELFASLKKTAGL